MLSVFPLHRHPPIIPYPGKVTRLFRAALLHFINFSQKNLLSLTFCEWCCKAIRTVLTFHAIPLTSRVLETHALPLTPPAKAKRGGFLKSGNTAFHKFYSGFKVLCVIVFGAATPRFMNFS
jgi:hypothetical protein